MTEIFVIIGLVGAFLAGLAVGWYKGFLSGRRVDPLTQREREAFQAASDYFSGVFCDLGHVQRKFVEALEAEHEGLAALRSVGGNPDTKPSPLGGGINPGTGQIIPPADHGRNYNA